ncbi:hypothetical protein BU15DRAFT_68660 [Melanogaster broomeanus]|nr:hypothetical protein BU15DRAFT_68660 [Melanogaster broomeanus]
MPPKGFFVSTALLSTPFPSLLADVCGVHRTSAFFLGAKGNGRQTGWFKDKTTGSKAYLRSQRRYNPSSHTVGTGLGPFVRPARWKLNEPRMQNPKGCKTRPSANVHPGMGLSSYGLCSSGRSFRAICDRRRARIESDRCPVHLSSFARVTKLETAKHGKSVPGPNGTSEITFITKNVTSGKVALGNGVAFIKKAGEGISPASAKASAGVKHSAVVEQHSILPPAGTKVEVSARYVTAIVGDLDVPHFAVERGFRWRFVLSVFLGTKQTGLSELVNGTEEPEQNEWNDRRSTPSVVAVRPSGAGRVSAGMSDDLESPYPPMREVGIQDGNSRLLGCRPRS